MAGTVLYCQSTVAGCSGCQGDRVMCFGAIDGGAGAGHEGSPQSCLGRSHERMYLAIRVDC